MDIIEIQCPNCGGTVKRKKDDYFAVCPYCNGEIGFNELKEEAAVTGMRSRLEVLDRHIRNEKKFKSERTDRKKNIRIFLMIGTFLYLIGLVLTSLADKDNPILGVGVISVLCSFVVILTSTFVFASTYSEFNDDKGAAESSPRIKLFMWLRLMGISILLFFFATIAAMLICVLIERRFLN